LVTAWITFIAWVEQGSWLFFTLLINKLSIGN
jgi:hypothetical protein